MPNCDKNDITLGSLPSDIIRLIINTISPQWYAVYLDFFRATINSVCWSKQIATNGNLLPRLRLTLLPRYLRWFGVDKWEITRISPDEVHACSGSILNDFLYTNAGEARLQRLFRRCSGIDRLEFRYGIAQSERELGIMKSTLGKLKIKTLAFTQLPEFNLDIGNQILNLLQTNAFRRLVLTPQRGPFQNQTIDSLAQSSNFFSKAVQLVSAIEISHLDLYPFHHSPYWYCKRDTIARSENVSVKLNEKPLNNGTLVHILVTKTDPSEN